MSLIITVFLVFVVAAAFSLLGKGGGEFYIPIMLTFLDLSYFDAAGLSLFMIFVQGLSMVAVYSFKNRLVDWKLALSLAVVVGISAFMGGFFSAGIPPLYLKIAFSAALLLSAYFLLLGKEVKNTGSGKFTWRRNLNGKEYTVNLPLLFLPVAFAAFLAGMVGISGGGLIVPICVLLGGVPIRIAIGTNTFLVLVSSFTGFTGHLARGGIDPKLAAIFGLTVVIGSQIGSHMHARVEEKAIRKLLAFILVLAAFWMLLRAFII